MIDLDPLLQQLSLEEKVSLLTGQDFWSLPAIPRIGLSSLVMSDGPVGVRGTGYTPDDPSVALPSPTALAATWDVALARRAGRLLGQESRRKGVHLLLGPTVNLHRTPLGGRHFECYSEDPLLTGEIAVGFVEGVQQHHVGTTVKHLVGNDFETERMTVDVRIPERALRELYLAPFERVAAAGGWGVMSAYNGVNGASMAANGRIQDEILKREWGFDGVVVSDWRAARDTVASALGGLDIAMPAMDNPWGPALVAAVRSGAVGEDVIDEKVRRVLLLAARTGALDLLGTPDLPLDEDGDDVAHDVAVGSFVLARNVDLALPLEPAELTRVAVIGALATDARVLGGGSAQVTPRHVISPLDGLRADLPGVDVAYAIGADPRPFLPAAQGPDWAPFRFVVHDHDVPVETATIRWIGDPPAGLDVAGITTLELHTELTPEVGGEHVLAVSGFGAFELVVGGEKLYEGSLHPPGTGRADLLLHPREQRFSVTLEAGVPVPVLLRQRFEPGAAHSVSTTLGHRAPGPDEEGLIAEAVELAARSDVAVVVVGTTEQVESEGFDRTSLALPGRQDELVSRVAAANPRTIVVVNAGSPVLLPWSEEVAAVLLTWFPGQEAGAALADVLLGVAEPGGRLPTTWPRSEKDCPVLDVKPSDGTLGYDEGIFIGYRGWLRQATEPLFAFGHGLGYTEWSYDHMAHSGSEVRVTVTNTGWRAGREVVQVYLSPGADTLTASEAPDIDSPVERPERWLAGFGTVDAEPGESVTVTIPIPERAFQVWNDGWQTVPGAYTVIAAHALDDPRRSIEITV
ncbi:glycoside hydrolase family 3 C-terminal domain-containing protein [Actinoplanes sichuanensis]|uniref:Glycoside hydrolase family 3 protein n=1 Tax=Actinoplanes sichuanensis TaxID=512349 RepID=A0ABW4A868_9ACTN|nr:glycoside hydrolase family 3 C-terminal domain-containing protein [Actinoplanes sichuanensis]BEL09401.1 glycoside hydrolase family 3 C-terminal domain-containing protein [Actinoplanes sichuanensis]